MSLLTRFAGAGRASATSSRRVSIALTLRVREKERDLITRNLLLFFQREIEEAKEIG